MLKRVSVLDCYSHAQQCRPQNLISIVMCHDIYGALITYETCVSQFCLFNTNF